MQEFCGLPSSPPAVGSNRVAFEKRGPKASWSLLAIVFSTTRKPSNRNLSIKYQSNRCGTGTPVSWLFSTHPKAGKYCVMLARTHPIT